MLPKSLLRFTSAVLFFTVLFVPVSSPAKTKRKSNGYVVSARSAILSDSTKGERLYERNPHRRVAPASTTKVMTALLVLEKLPLTKYVTVSKKASQAQPSIIGLKPGEQYRVSDLLYAVLLKSANDASIVLAEAVAGSEWAFVNMMNKRAQQLGAKNTKFANSHGLPTKKVSQYTTAYDMYLIFRQALKQKFFKGAIQLKYKSIASKTGRAISLKSHNKMLFFDWATKVYGKTGYTRAAQQCFVGTFQKGKSTMIIAVFGCTRRWTDIKHIIQKYGGVIL